MGQVDVVAARPRRATTESCEMCRPVTGRVPYGYRAVEREGGRSMEPDPHTAPVVQRIFEEYAAGSGLQLIAERLTAAGVLCPSAYDPRRNPRHTGSAWSKLAVRAIITNDRYAGHDGDVEATVRTSCEHCHGTREVVALVPFAVRQKVRELLARRGEAARTSRSAGQSPDRYPLRGRLRCVLCRRLMQGTWNNRTAYYRCRFPREYARANNIDHPANVYLREDRLVPALHRWICQSLPARIEDWSRRQPAGTRLLWADRTAELCRLIANTNKPAHSARVYAALGLGLVYKPNQEVVQVRSEALPDAVILDHFTLA